MCRIRDGLWEPTCDDHDLVFASSELISARLINWDRDFVAHGTFASAATFLIRGISSNLPASGVI